MLKTYVSKWGNSLSVRLPKAICDMLNWKKGQALIIEVKDETIILRKG
jgi:AbrB family looped-hinge helix DNA binding protein